MAVIAPVNALAQASLGCADRNEAQAPQVITRDERGIAQVRLPELPSALPANVAFTVWLPHPGFEPFPTPAAVFPSTRIQTQGGALEYCIPYEAVANASAGGLIQVSFDPSIREPIRYALHPAIDLAARDGLLSARQRALTQAAQQEFERNTEAVTRALADFASSPRSPAAQERLVAALTGARQLRSVDPAELDVARLLDRSQRTYARRRGVAVEGVFSLTETPTHLELSATACSWAQLAREWNARVGQLSPVRAQLVHARPGLTHEEAPDLSLRLTITEREAGYRMLAHALASLAGLSLTE